MTELAYDIGVDFDAPVMDVATVQAVIITAPISLFVVGGSYPLDISSLIEVPVAQAVVGKTQGTVAFDAPVLDSAISALVPSVYSELVLEAAVTPGKLSGVVTTDLILDTIVTAPLVVNVNLAGVLPVADGAVTGKDLNVSCEAPLLNVSGVSGGVLNTYFILDAVSGAITPYQYVAPVVVTAPVLDISAGAIYTNSLGITASADLVLDVSATGVLEKLPGSIISDMVMDISAIGSALTLAPVAINGELVFDVSAYGAQDKVGGILFYLVLDVDNGVMGYADRLDDYDFRFQPERV